MLKNYKLNSNKKYKLKVFSTADALHMAAAEFIVSAAKEAIATRGRIAISLSGGQTPQKLFSLLATPEFSTQIDWKNTFLFWGDERCVPLDDERNNAHQAILLLLDKVGVLPGNVFRIPVNLPPTEAAAAYEKTIQLFFGNKLPQFDLVLLGLGADGHTASLFPFTKVLEEQSAGVRAVYAENQKEYRITLTAPLINQSSCVLFLVEGKGKAEILNKILTGEYQPDAYPAQLINPADGELHWFADNAAAGLVTPQP